MLSKAGCATYWGTGKCESAMTSGSEKLHGSDFCLRESVSTDSIKRRSQSLASVDPKCAEYDDHRGMWRCFRRCANAANAGTLSKTGRIPLCHDTPLSSLSKTVKVHFDQASGPFMTYVTTFSLQPFEFKATRYRETTNSAASHSFFTLQTRWKGKGALEQRSAIPAVFRRWSVTSRSPADPLGAQVRKTRLVVFTSIDWDDGQGKRQVKRVHHYDSLSVN
jgi:hypothetical protein